MMSLHSLSSSRELAVVHKGSALIVKNPQLARDEFAISGKESG